MSGWTDELKATVIEQYKAAEPTPETTTEIVAEIAKEHGMTVNGVRMVLVKSGEYVTAGKAKSSGSSNGEDKPKRKSKQESLDELTTLLEDHGVEVDDSIVSKLTGKAAEYFIASFKHVIEN